MSGRDMEAVARGIEESLQDDHIRARVGQALISVRRSETTASRLSSRSVVTVYLSMRASSCRMCRKRNFRRRHWPLQSISTQVSGAWSGAPSLLEETRRPAKKTGRSSNRPADDPASRVYPGAHGCGSRNPLPQYLGSVRKSVDWQWSTSPSTCVFSRRGLNRWRSEIISGAHPMTTRREAFAALAGPLLAQRPPAAAPEPGRVPCR